MVTVTGNSHSIEYLETAMAAYKLLKMNHSFKIDRILLDYEEKYVSFKIEKVVHQ